jgi:hypothetical protein
MDPIGIVFLLRAMRTVRPLSVAAKLRLAAPGVPMTCPFVPRRMVNFTEHPLAGAAHRNRTWQHRSTVQCRAGLAAKSQRCLGLGILWRRGHKDSMLLPHAVS